MRPLPWSHSSLEKFISCPKQFYHVKVACDIVEPPGEAALWGTRVHTAFEEYLRSAGSSGLPAELEHHRGYLDSLLAHEGTLYVEHSMALDTSLSPCDWDDAWVRGVADVLIVHGSSARVVDHKTGKMKPDSRQLMLMALLTFHHFPEVQQCETAFQWLKFGRSTSASYKRENSQALWNRFAPDLVQYKRSFATDVWPARQSGLCNGWCPVTTCDFWRDKS